MDAQAPVRGFILQPTYRIERGRPVVHLYGLLETGESFLVRDRRHVPAFYVLERDRERVVETAQGVGPFRLVESDRVSLRGEPVTRVEVAKPSDAPRVRDRLHKRGLVTFEADVRVAVRYLIDRGIRGSLEIRGESRPGSGVDRVFEDPDVAPADWVPRLGVLSFDIETDPEAERLLSIALWGCGAAEVLMLCPEGASRPAGSVRVAGFGTEAELLAGFAHRVREIDPDVLTGWNVIDFDLAVLARLSERWGGVLELGRGPGTVRLARGFRRGPSHASVPGRIVLDGIQLLRGASIRMESYALDAVARKVLGEGKTHSAGEGGREILRRFEEDRPALAEYNLTDARLALEILEHFQLVELAVERSRLTGLPPERLGASIAAFDFLYLSELGRRGVVAPTVGSGGEEPGETAGGHVLEPRPGLYENVPVFDFRSLYPSLIRTFGIDPLNHVAKANAGRGEGDGDEDLVVAPNGAAFRRRAGILPAMLDELFPRREAARRAGDPVTSYAIKILMNSFYGVLATSACRFHSPQIANAITGFGREVLLWTRDRIAARGHRVLYGDTDSLFVESDLAGVDTARAFAEGLAADLNRELAEWIAGRWRVESRLELRFERLYLKLLLPSRRHGGRGARKRYVGLVEEGGERRTVFTGMEVVRRDWTELARRVQQELYERLFGGGEVEPYLRQVLAELEAGELDDLLVYYKGLRKDPKEYTSTTPPHVAAARKLSGPVPDVMAYVVTVAGPEPAAEREHAFDYGHYVEKQIRPVAEPVLELVGVGFDALTGRGEQLGLF